MLDRRVQLLLDAKRYDKVAAAARREETSVAEVIRRAIDEALPDPGVLRRRRRALEDLLAAPPAPVPEDPADLRRELDDAHDRIRW